MQICQVFAKTEKPPTPDILKFTENTFSELASILSSALPSIYTQTP